MSIRRRGEKILSKNAARQHECEEIVTDAEEGESSLSENKRAVRETAHQQYKY